MILLYLIDSLSLGGAETIVVNTLNYINDKYPDIKITLATTVTDGGILKKKLNNTIQYRHFKCSKDHFFKGVFQLKKYAQAHHITHIHAHLFHSIIIGRLIKISSVNLFETYHNLEYDKRSVYYSWWRVYLDKLTYKKNSFSIYVSEDVAKPVQRLRKHKNNHVLLNNFAGMEFVYKYNFTNNNTLKLIAIGNLKLDKNFIYALETFTHFKSFSISLDIYGEGPLRAEFENFIKINNIRVRLMGRHQMDSDILSSYDAFLMTSLNEGMPISLLEAMGVGLPSVLPSHLPVMEEVAHTSARYFSINDCNELSKLLVEILENKEMLSAMSITAAHQSKLYNIDTHVSKLLEVYTKQ